MEKTNTLPKPMDNLLNMLSGLSAGHEKALKQGIYNAVALFLLCLVSAAGYGLYIVLNPFLKPLIWALLCGSVLFPFKSSLTSIVHSWFTSTEESNTLFLFSLSVVPISIFDKVSEFLGSFLDKHLRYVLSAISCLLGLLIVYNYTPNLLCCLIWRLLMVFNSILNLLISECNIFLLTGVIIGYFSILLFYWTPANSSQFCYSSFVIWFIISLYLSNAIGTYPVIVFCSFQVLFFIGLVYEVILTLDRSEIDSKKMSFMEIVRFALTNDDCSASNSKRMPILIEEKCPILEVKETDAKEVVKFEAKSLDSKPFLKLTGRSMSMDTDADKTVYDHPTRRVRSASSVSPSKISISDRYFLKKLRSELRMTLDTEDSKVDTDKYMYGIMYACIGMILWKHKWIIAILVIPIAYYYLKKVASYFGFGKTIMNKCLQIMKSINSWCEKRYQALIPANIRGLYKVCIIVDHKLTQILKGSVDAVVTVSVILGLIIFVICTSTFITIQIYKEGIHLVQISGEILNSTIINHPDIDWVPEQWEESVNSVLDNAYTYGRSAISSGIHQLVKDSDPAKAEQVEKKVLELWDRLYQAWMMSNDSPDTIGPTVDASAAISVWESLKESFGKTPLQFFNINSIENFARENVGILMSVLESVWSIIKGNMSVVLSIVTELMYTVLLSGSAVLNFMLSMIVFFTALFYLLSSSGKIYKPIELITNFSPISCHRFAIALQESVIGVFTATFKWASFIGMWTWFVHNLFQVEIVYLPSVFATLLGAVPILDAYFACIPATLELWFTQGPFIAVIFFLLHFLACSLIVTEFYMEIKGGGHPYLTGLSIVGGVFCLGIEGTIFGPLLLCCIMVVINLSRRYLQSPSEEAINSIKSQIAELES